MEKARLPGDWPQGDMRPLGGRPRGAGGLEIQYREIQRPREVCGAEVGDVAQMMMQEPQLESWRSHGWPVC